MIRRLLREPLLHFAVLGGALFSAYAILAPAAAESSAIVVSSDQIASIAAQFRGTWQRPPSPAELDALVEGYIRDEVLYREGLALGLERDDPVVRNRVKQKMEILSEDALSKEPTDVELQKYLDDHREVFEIPAAITFEQVYFDLDRHGERIVADLQRALGALRAGRTVNGDRTLLPLRMERVLPPDIAATFGAEYEKSIRELPVGVWSDALRSSFGYHLVRVTWRGRAIVPSLADARDTVLREWTRAHTVDTRERLYRSLRERYTVTLAPAQDAALARGLP